MATDFDFLQGPFDVTGRRRPDALTPDSDWFDVPATSTAVRLLDGAVNLDEMWFPDEQRFGLSLRLYEPASRSWTVRWFDGRGLQPPVRGEWRDGRCWFTGADEYRGRSLQASYSWSEVRADGASWEQCFSLDDGQTWIPNWTMRYTRRAAPVEHPRAGGDFDFLVGRWRVRHRRVLDPVGHALGESSETVEFEGVQTAMTFCAGAVSVDETTLQEPGHRGLTFRVHDPLARRWSIYWVNSRSGRLEPPVHGEFRDGVGTFFGREELGGHDVQVRFVWSDITPTSARWRQSFRVAGGEWAQNWEMTFTRLAAS